MKADKYSKISKYSLLALFVAIIAVLVMFFVLGEQQTLALSAEEAQEQTKPLLYPQYTDALIYLCYIMLALSIFLTLALSFVVFVRRLIDRPGEAIGGLVPTIVLAAVGVVVYILSPGMVDWMLYIQYILLVACVLCSIVGMIGLTRAVGKK